MCLQSQGLTSNALALNFVDNENLQCITLVNDIILIHKISALNVKRLEGCDMITDVNVLLSKTSECGISFYLKLFLKKKKEKKEEKVDDSISCSMYC